MIDLYDYQKEALKNLKTGSVLCGGTGSGKSIVSLVYFQEHEFPKDLYIITTAKKRDSLEWQRECIPFTFQARGADVYVDSWNNIVKYISVKDAFFIFDEQRVVGNGSWAKSFLNITKSNNWILLSATPADTYMDWIPIFLAHGFYRTRTEFIREHVVYDRYVKYKVSKYIGRRKLDYYISKVLVKMDRPIKVAKLYTDITCEYNKESYKTIFKNRWNFYDNSPIENPSQWCYLQRKVCNSDISRIKNLEKLLNKHKTSIVFYNFDYELEMIKTFLDSSNIRYTEWNGHKHQNIPSGDRWVYLLQYSAGSEAWNCITTNVIIFYSLNYSYRINKQCEGRIDRVNTPFDILYYYRLVSNSKIDQAIIKCIDEKKNFNIRSFERLA